MIAEFSDIDGPHGLVHHSRNIYVLVRRDDDFLTGRKISQTINQKKLATKATKKDFIFMEKFKKADKYSKLF